MRCQARKNPTESFFFCFFEAISSSTLYTRWNISRRLVVVDGATFVPTSFLDQMNRILAEKCSLQLLPWSHHRSPSSKQLLLKRTKASWSNWRLLALLEDLDVPIESARETQKTKAINSEILRHGLPTKLPLSPLMNPNLIAARQRHREPKPKLQSLSPMEIKLRGNPYGIYSRGLNSAFGC